MVCLLPDPKDAVIMDDGDGPVSEARFQLKLLLLGKLVYIIVTVFAHKSAWSGLA